MRRRRPYVGPGHELEIWELRRGREVLAKLELIHQDFHTNFPWMYANIFPTAAFEAVKDLFCELPDDEDGRIQRQGVIERQIVLCLAEPDLRPVREFTMVVDGERARFKIDEKLP